MDILKYLHVALQILPAFVETVAQVSQVGGSATSPAVHVTLGHGPASEHYDLTLTVTHISDG